MGAAWIAQATRANIVIIPYKGTGPALNDLLGAQIHTTFANILNVSPHIKSGRLRALAVSSGERSRVMPELPTIAESGVPGFDVTTWHGWLAPAGTPLAILDKIHAELAKFVRTPALAENSPSTAAKRWATHPPNSGASCWMKSRAGGVWQNPPG